jgi:hypothetical protein
MALAIPILFEASPLHAQAFRCGLRRMAGSVSGECHGLPDEAFQIELWRADSQHSSWTGTMHVAGGTGEISLAAYEYLAGTALPAALRKP